MALYILIGLDKLPHQMPLRDSIRVEHRRYVRDNHRAIRLGGATVDDAGNQNGSVLVFEADSSEAVWEWIRRDPFYQAGVYQSIEVRRWDLVLGGICDPAS